MVTSGFFLWYASARPLAVATLVSELSTRNDRVTLPPELPPSSLPPQAARARDATATPTTTAVGRRLFVSFISFLHRRDVRRTAGLIDATRCAGSRRTAGPGEVGGAVSSVSGQGLLQRRVEFLGPVEGALGVQGQGEVGQGRVEEALQPAGRRDVVGQPGGRDGGRGPRRPRLGVVEQVADRGVGGQGRLLADGVRDV